MCIIVRFPGISMTIFIAVVVGTVCLAVILIVITVLVYRYKLRKRYVGYSRTAS